MRRLILKTILTLLPFIGFTQVRLGFTESEIRAYFPDNIFKKDRLSDGSRYISSDMEYGNMAYYFAQDGLSILNIQMPYSTREVNVLVSLYNEKYVKVSNTQWIAYMDRGQRMLIQLVYVEKSDTTMFTYEYIPD